MEPLIVLPLTVENFRLYGWLLGKPFPVDGHRPAFRNLETDFSEEHVFDAGVGGQTEVLWVNYRNKQRIVTRLEVHRLTQQAIVPLTGEILQIVAASEPDGSVDLRSLRGFRVGVGEGICLRPNCWHGTRVDVAEVRCLMLTRRSTTIDLIAYLNDGRSLAETEMVAIERKLPD